MSEYRTVRDTIEFLASGYSLLVVYFWRPDSDSNAVSNAKKIYFGDPLMGSVVQHATPGLSRSGGPGRECRRPGPPSPL